jgi:hypothetical protein
LTESRKWFYKEAATLFINGQYEELLHLIQDRLLHKAATRNDAIRLLLVINELLPLQPELGKALYGAYNWVDAFLKGKSNIKSILSSAESL